MKVAYFGTAEFSKSIFEGLFSFSDVEIVCTVSQPDSPVGRKREILPTPLKQASLLKGIPCYQPEKVKKNEEFISFLKGQELDFIIVVAYGKILPLQILEIPKHGTINIHGSLLPKYRGASPIQEALKNGDNETGLTIMLMSEGMDEGDILAKAKVKVDIVDNAQTIFDKFASLGPKLLHTTLQEYISGKIVPEKQNERHATYCGKIEKEDGFICFQKQTAREIYQQFQAYFLWPGIYTFVDGKRLVVEDCFFSDFNDTGKNPGAFVTLGKNSFGITCREGVLILKKVKPEGKKSMDVGSFVNGNKEVFSYIFL